VPSWLDPKGPPGYAKKKVEPETPEKKLNYSARNRDIKGLRSAIQAGAKVDAFEEGDAALHWAAFWGDREIGQLLLEADADMTSKNRFGFTPIEDAYRGNNREMGMLLTKWQKKGTAQSVAMKRRIVEWAVQKHEVNTLRQFVEEQKDDFLMKIHVDTAEAEMAKIIRVQEAQIEKMIAAMQHQDIDALQAAVKTALTFDTLRGPNPVMQPELRHPMLIEAEDKLKAMLEEEEQFKRKIKRIEEIPFGEANVEALEKTLFSARASPVARRLSVEAASQHLKAIKAEREDKVHKLEKVVEKAVQMQSPEYAKSGDPELSKEEKQEAIEAAVEKANHMLREVESLKPLRKAVKEAKEALAQCKAEA